GFTDVVVGDQHADALGLEVVDDLLDVAHGDRVDTGERFVEQDELGRGGQCPGNLHPAPLTTGQAHAQVVADVADVKFLQQAFKLLAATIAVEFLAGLEDRHDVVGHRQLAKDRGFLRQVADAGTCATMHGLVADVQVVDQHAALVGLYQADDHVEAGGLAGAVGAEQADDLAAVDGQADITHDLPAFVGLGQVLGFEGCHLLGLLLRLDHHVDARTRLGDFATATSGSDLLHRVVDDFLAFGGVAFIDDLGAVDQHDAVLWRIVLNGLAVALHLVRLGCALLLLEVGQVAHRGHDVDIAGGSAGDGHGVAFDHHRALGDDHVTGIGGNAFLVIQLSLVSLDTDRLI
uniref:RNA polymerase beta subunit n=1 Tax=Steinernema glaseri TaxID=37863 RepID=A0A1I7Y9Y7_9BILA